MWYKNDIGKEFECTLENSEHTLFNSYTEKNKSYKTIEQIEKTNTKKHSIIDLSIGYKILLNSNEVIENIKVNGWILSEDVEVKES